MQAFLEKTADYIYNKFGDDIGEICIVLPNRRAGLFLKKYLAKRIKKTIWSPAIFSSEDFIAEISELQIVDNISLLFELYKTHKTIEKEKAQDFDEFVSWGQVLMHDFNEIDLHQIEAEKIFSYLSDAKVIALWNLNKKPLTDFEKNYLKFYSSLNKYYSLLKEQLLSKNQAYQGLTYRKVTEEIEDKLLSLKWKKIIFAGFNALNNCEEKIIKSLVNSDKAEILWDADNYYLENTKQEAGKFLRKYFRTWQKSEIKWKENNFLESSKKITIIGVPKNVGQVKVAGQLLSEIQPDEKHLQKNAVVLADENLLIPLLNSIPENINEFNVTMGLPLKYTPAYDLFNALFALHENAKKMSALSKTGETTNIKTSLKFYYKDIVKIFNHPYLLKIDENTISTKEISLSKIIDDIQNANKVFFSYEEIKSIFSGYNYGCPKIVETLFNQWDNPSEILKKLVELITIIRDAFLNNENEDSEKKSTEIELEYLYAVSKIIKRVKSLICEYEGVENISTLHMIFNSIIKVSTLSFYGEPLKGLQIMGMLETRTLDFENIILLSANEGIIPSGKTANSFIPFDIKREFNMPTYRDKDAIFAYHFYRLLQASKNIYILYNTESDLLGGGDKSRFVTQIINELPKYNPKIEIEEKVLAVPPVKDETDYSITIEKDEDVLSKIKEKAMSGFSPSSLNSYRNCSLRFYFQYIAKIKELEEVEETIDAATLGTVTHKVLQDLYEPIINLELTPDLIKNMFPKVETMVKNVFRKEYKNGDVDFGKNLLIVRVANSFIKNFLNREIKFIKELQKNEDKIFIKLLEKDLDSNISLNEIPDIKLIGKIDRIDRVGDTLRIIDYKTGRTEQKELTIKEWENLIYDTKHDKAFQLLTYAYIFQNSKLKTSDAVESGIISFRNLSSGFLKVKTPDSESITTKELDEFEIILKNLIEEILDKEIPFTQTDEVDNCEYCAFKSICYR